jgi:hypothetical protein
MRLNFRLPPVVDWTMVGAGVVVFEVEAKPVLLPPLGEEIDWYDENVPTSGIESTSESVGVLVEELEIPADEEFGEAPTWGMVSWSRKLDKLLS